MEKIYYFIIITVFISSCSVGGSAVYKSDDIDSKMKNEIASLNKKFCDAVINKDIETTKSLLAPKLLEKMEKSATENLDELFQLSETFSILSDLQTIDEFFVTSSPGATVIIPSQITQTEDYIINFKPLSNESYVSLVKAKGERKHCALLLFIYGKYNNEWKINIYYIGNYSLHNQTAPFYYEKAKTEYNNRNLINSFINIYLTLEILKPGGEVFTYNIEDEANKLNIKIMNEINNSYKFPIQLDAIDSKPEIFHIYPQEIENTYAPMVNYITKIDLKDTIQLRLENEKIRKIIPNYFKGINDNHYILYRAYNEMPNDLKPVERFGFVHSLK